MKSIVFSIIFFIPLTVFSQPVYLECTAKAQNESAKEIAKEKIYEIILEEKTKSVVHKEDGSSSSTKADFSVDKVKYRFLFLKQGSAKVIENFEIDRNDLGLLVYGTVKISSGSEIKMESVPSYKGSCTIKKGKSRKF
jgi:hypothetical protein